MGVIGDQWGSMGINGGQWQSMALNGSQWGSMAVSGSHWGSMGINGSQWGSMGSMAVNGSQWQSMGSMGTRGPWGRGPELEAYGAALAQLRALLGLAERLLASSPPGCLFPPEEAGMGPVVLRECSTMRNGCFYGRCLGFQFAPSLRPLLQAIAIGLVSFGENYKPNDTGLGVAAGSLFTSGKFALDPELRGDQFERLTQNLDVQFWKRFWNLTETELLASVASMASAPVGLCRELSVPPEPLELPLHGDPGATVTIAPPVAHTGPGPVHMRLLSYHLRDGQDSAALLALSRSEGPRAPLRWFRGGPALPPSPSLLVHFHGGGFVAQTSRSHEPYLRGWARELGAPILSVDYALAPEAPFPRALEECFYAYCWALRNCRLLGSTAQRVCLAGDSAGGNLCLSVSLRAAAMGVRPPQGIVAAYPVTLVQAAASPSRLLTLLDPLLPISVLCQCLRAYAGADEDGDPAPPSLEPPSPPRVLLQELRRGAAQWLGGLFRGAPPKDAPPAKNNPEQPPPQDGAGTPPNDTGTPPNDTGSPQKEGGDPQNEGDPEFRPLRIQGPPARFLPPPAPLARNPFMSPLLAPEPLLGALPPVHLVACALDPMLDDSVSLARRLRDLGRPVTLHVVPDLPHGFLSLGALSPETRRATALCTRLIRGVLHPPDPHLGGRRGSLFLGGRRDSLDPQLGLRRGSTLLGGRRESLAPQDGPRRGSVLLGGPREGLDPHLGGRRGSVLLGGRRDSTAPQDGARRGSVMLGTHRDSPDPHLGGRRGSVLLGGRRESLDPHLGGRRGSVLLENPRRGSVMLGTHRDSPAPQDGARRGSGVLGTHSDSPDPHLGGRRGSAMLGTHRDSSAPQDGARRGSGVLGGRGEKLVTHGNGAAGTHSDGAALPHSTSKVLTHSNGAAGTQSDGATQPHSPSPTPPPQPHIGGAPPSPPRPPPCCGAPPGPPQEPPNPRRPSGPAGREVGS
ncbi:hormone-sensitive lipase isoform X1 [Patagioenas fasciata]|uniref:hormone-sensitive lipase isoform X1 n=1 Tax=Patagioenas fasciata TaxID=372321 RepID=UPI003A98EC3F